MNKTRLGRGACLLAALALGAACLAQPQAAAQSFRQGVSLCLYTLLPALFPFLVLCGWLTANLPGRGLWFALVSSWLGGYAVCAHNTAALRRGGRLDNARAQRFLVLGCCSSPGFVIGCVGGQLLGSVTAGAALYALQLAANLLCAALLAPWLRPQEKHRGPLPASLRPPQQSSFSDAVSQAADSCLHLCGCVVFFRTISGVISRFLPPGLQPLLSVFFGHCRPYNRLRRSCGARRRGGAVRLLRLPEPAGLFCLCADAGHPAGMCAAAAAFCFPPCALWAFSAPCPPLPAASAAGTAGIFQPGSARCSHEPPVARYGGDRFLLLLRRSLQNRTKKL